MGTRGSRIALSCRLLLSREGRRLRAQDAHARSERKQKRPHRPVDDRSRREAIASPASPVAWKWEANRASDR